MREHAGDDVADVERRRREKDLLDAVVGAADHERPHDDGRDRHDDVLRHPNSSRLLATPANSATTLPKFVTTSVTITKNVTRKPNSSRIRSLNPLPVTAPMRAAISCTTTSATVIGIMVHKSV